MEHSKAVAHLDTLSSLARHPRLAKGIIKSAEDTLIDAIAECALQIVTGVVKVSEESKPERLKKILPFIKFLASHRVSCRKKRNFLLRGGSYILNLILPPVLGYIAKHL